MALISVCFFWGTTYLGIRMALETVPPLALVSIRFLLSGSILLAAAAWRGSLLPRGRDLRSACISGALILGIGNGALVFAELRIPSGLAGLFITISPFWMVGIEALLPGGERLHWPTLFGMLVGLGGAALLLAPDLTGHSLGRNTLAGFLILQLGMASWSFGSIFQKRQEMKAHPIVVGAIHQLAAGIAFTPLALLVPEHPIVWTTRGAGAVLYLVIFGSIVGYSAYAYALDKLPVAVVSIYPYLNSMVAVTLGWLVYREPFGWREALAMAIIFTGVALVKRYAKKAPQSLPSTLAPIAPPAVQNTEIMMNQKSRKKR
ncbi:MAG TPA: EamA family transporter [Bryobacteraceae bacterium]|nr:EamA family transporter [Bryobacteraceae bacterium]